MSNLSINAGGTTSTLTVELVDPAGNPGPAPSGGQTLSLTTTSAVGSFSQSGSPVTQVVIPAGQSTATFQYSDNRAGTPTITVGQAQDSVVGVATATVTVNPAALDHMVVTPAAVTVAVGGHATFAAEGYDAYNNDLGSETSAATWSISPSTDGSSCTGATCTVGAAGCPHRHGHRRLGNRHGHPGR